LIHEVLCEHILQLFKVILLLLLQMKKFKLREVMKNCV
jgi:hypothetical protein